VRAGGHGSAIVVHARVGARFWNERLLMVDLEVRFDGLYCERDITRWGLEVHSGVITFCVRYFLRQLR
jgi:hypothetical protein